MGTMGRQRCRRVMRGTSYKIPGNVRALSRIASTHPTRMFESSLRSDWWIYLIQLNNKYLGNVYDRANYKIRNTRISIEDDQVSMYAIPTR